MHESKVFLKTVTALSGQKKRQRTSYCRSGGVNPPKVRLHPKRSPVSHGCYFSFHLILSIFVSVFSLIFLCAPCYCCLCCWCGWGFTETTCFSCGGASAATWIRSLSGFPPTNHCCFWRKLPGCHDIARYGPKCRTHKAGD